MLKKEARKLFLEKRVALTHKECVKLDDLLLIQFQKIQLGSFNCIGSFYPLDHQNEPNSLLFVKYLTFFIPDLKVVYPVIDPTGEKMNFYNQTKDTLINKWGIHEPLSIDYMPTEKIEVFLVPLIGFDERGHRIGFGKGFYDRFFENCTHNPKRIGISYFDPIPRIEDTHEFDVPLTHCITPWNSYEF